MINSSTTKGRTTTIFIIGLIATMLSLLAFASPNSSAGAAEISAAALQLSLADYVTTGLDLPLGLVNTGLGDTRLFVYEKEGRIKIIKPNGPNTGQVLSTPFLDITDRVQSAAPEGGLLGLVFDPNYTNNGYFYVNYVFQVSSALTATRISRFQVSANPDIANTTEDILLTVDQPFINHKAGDLHFGPDGYLYIPLGDGGSLGDPLDNAQDMSLLLGKIIRIDVKAQTTGDPPDCKGAGSGHYTIPTSNPFRDGAGGVCDEIWASGLRNPWRSSFDRLTGDFYIADVGQGDWEEVNLQAVNSTGGQNYGWRCYEGNNHPFNLAGCQASSHYTPPIFEYDHSDGNCTVIGGYVYRGTKYPAMYGHYLLTDYCTGIFRDLIYNNNVWQATQHTNMMAVRQYVAFGEDAHGELYVVNMALNKIHRLVENTPSPPPTYLPIVVKNSITI